MHVDVVSVCNRLSDTLRWRYVQLFVSARGQYTGRHTWITQSFFHPANITWHVRQLMCQQHLLFPAMFVTQTHPSPRAGPQLNRCLGRDGQSALGNTTAASTFPRARLAFIQRFLSPVRRELDQDWTYVGVNR
ncbi:hypothetical protein BaRGS_00022188 [Batillaria attramentaria]|uniref:Uncharacterized protein n=1 Tax=Batillaria attramentaria TaxID=370345 RepID=A0ABD0KHI9_9CAEN